MNLKDHVSDEMLDLIVGGELSDEIGRTAALHLSYCPLCRDRKNDLALKLAAEQMWSAYDRSAPPKDAHIKDNVFREFWLGQSLDDELIKHTSHHCIVCCDCRAKRERFRTQVENERRQVSVWVLLAAIRSDLKKRGRTILLASLVLLVGAICAAWLATKLLPYVQTTQQHSANNNPTRNQAQNDNSSYPAPDQSAQVREAPSPSPKPSSDNKGELLAQAQRFDLTKADSPEVREPESTAPSREFQIVVSRASPTLLQIVLPPNSKRGRYDVSIRDAAFLAELVSVRGSSSNGGNLLVSIDLRTFKADAYVLRITRRDPKTNRDEYLGDFNVRILEQRSVR